MVGVVIELALKFGSCLGIWNLFHMGIGKQAVQSGYRGGNRNGCCMVFTCWLGYALPNLPICLAVTGGLYGVSVELGTTSCTSALALHCADPLTFWRYE